MTDGSTGSKRFDPRFDPAFQPGYDPRNDPSMPARTVAQEPAFIRPDVIQAPPPRLPAAQHRAPEPAESDAEPAAPVQQSAADDPVSPRGTNPYVVLLWVVSVLLVAAGIAVLRAVPALEEQATGTAGQTSFVQMFGIVNLAAVFIGCGVLVAAGNLFLLAVRWRGRAADRDD